MKKIFITTFFLATLVSGSFAQKKTARDKELNNAAISYLNRSFGVYDRLQKSIWSNPELGFLDTESSRKHQDHLREKGVAIESGVAGMPTA